VTALRAASATDVGRVRSNNQDSLLVADPLFAVADGMGGAAAGEVASALALEALAEHFPPPDGRPPTPDALVEAAAAANRAVWAKAEAHPEMRGMGTTLVALARVEGGSLAVVNVGDSRLYCYSRGELRQVTADHSLVAEMVAEGRLSPAEAEVHPRRNIMTRALGPEPDVQVDLFVEDPHPGDRFVLCSDGLPREVGDDAIAAVLRRYREPRDAARELVTEARQRGGSDNITVVVVDVADPGAAPAAASEAAPEPVAPEPVAPGPRPSRRPTPPVLTVRVLGFLLLLLLVLGAGLAALLWYGRSSYFVTLRGSSIVIYQGRPGGVLWIQPTLAATTPYTSGSVQASNLADLRSGHPAPSLAAARSYVANLVAEYQRDLANAAPPTTAAGR
jgi:serine/threonine protein phosphatase PrpC